MKVTKQGDHYLAEHRGPLRLALAEGRTRGSAMVGCAVLLNRQRVEAGQRRADLGLAC